MGWWMLRLFLADALAHDYYNICACSNIPGRTSSYLVHTASSVFRCQIKYIEKMNRYMYLAYGRCANHVCDPASGLCFT